MRLEPIHGEAAPAPGVAPVTMLDVGAAAVAVAAGGEHWLALRTDRHVMAWGSNECGQLGDGTRRDRSAPVRVRDLQDVAAVAAGVAHSLALGLDGSVRAWGYNIFGQLADGTRRDRHTPAGVAGLEAGVVGIAAGDHTGLALREDGSVLGWGLSVANKLGVDHIPDAPIPIPGLEGGICAIAAGRHHQLALTDDGHVLSWGLGAGHLTPEPVEGLADVVAVSAGDLHSLALLRDGSLRTWDANYAGQLGDGTNAARPDLAAVKGLARVRCMAGGGWCSFAVDVDGAAFAWGSNRDGRLGDGSVADRYAPVPVRGCPGAVTAIAERVALLADGSVVTWGGPSGCVEADPTGAIPLGATKLGGRPDLPPATPWPERDGRPMTFVAQVNGDDLPQPIDGLLSFFCAPPDLGSPGSGRVVHTPPGAPLARVPAPDALPAHERFRAAALTPRPELSLPPTGSGLRDTLGMTDAEYRAYEDLLTKLLGDAPLHRTGGHPDPVQADPRDGDPGLWLLLQVDSDDAAGMQWGDGGRLYYWIAPEDLKAGRFDRVRLDHQSH